MRLINYSDFLTENVLTELLMESKVVFSKKFINLLMAEKGLNVEEANAVTNAILDNPEINTLDEAFDLTKGGITPKTHKRRSLDIADNKAFSEFFENNLFDNL